MDLKCPECKADLGPPAGFDIYPLEDNPDGSPGGVVEEDQYICDNCKRFVTHAKIFENGTAREELTAGSVMGEDTTNVFP